MHISANLAQSALLELSRARIAYDDQIRQQLGSDLYRKYQEFERDKPYRAEVEMISDYLSEHGGNISTSRDVLLQALRDARAFTGESTHGPYDPIPHPSARISDSIPYYSDVLHRVEEAMPRLANILPSIMSPDLAQQVNAYFLSRLQQFQNQISVASQTPEQRKLELLQRVEQQNGQTPSP